MSVCTEIDPRTVPIKKKIVSITGLMEEIAKKTQRIQLISSSAR